MINIKLIEARLSELFTKAEGMNPEDEERLFRTQIAPLVSLQRLYLKENGGIPQFDVRYDKWKKKNQKI